MAGAKDYFVPVKDIPNYGPPDMAAQLYSMIRGIPQAYQEGVENRYKNQQSEFQQNVENPFKASQYARTERLQAPIVDDNGKPTTNFDTMSTELLKRGGGEMAEKLLPYLWKSKYAEGSTKPQPWDSAGGASAPPPDMQTAQPLQDAAARQGQTANPDLGRDDVTSLRGLATQYNISIDSPAFKREFKGIPLDREDFHPDVVGMLDTRLKDFAARQRGEGGPAPAPQQRWVVPPGASGPAAQGPAAAGGPMASAAAGPSAEAAPSNPGADLVPHGWLAGGGRGTGFPPTVLGYAQWLQGEARKSATIGNTEAAKIQAAHADKILGAIQQAAEPTGAQKEARDTQVNLAKAAGKLGEDVATAKGKRIGEYIEAGGLPNRQMVNTLAEMEDTLKHGGTNISTGPGAERWLKVKQMANNLFPGAFKGLTETEMAVKLNTMLSAAAAKAMTSRPTEREFRAFQGANAGIMNSPQGSYALISILRQAKEQELGLSRLAMNAKNYDNWTDVEDKFFEEHKIISPLTGKPLGEEAKGGAGPAAPLPPPQVGTVVGGHRYRGGALNDPRSWEAIRPGDRS